MFRSKKKKEEIKSSSSHISAPQLFASKSKDRQGSKKAKVYGVPFIYEQQYGEAITKRTELMVHHANTLGPPDLVHLSNHHGSKEHGQFHYITGLDLSSIAAPVAYLTKLVYNTQFDSNGNQMASSSSSLHSVGIYSSWNCFSKCDIRIKTEFPGQKATVQLVGINGKPFHVRQNSNSRIRDSNSRIRDSKNMSSQSAVASSASVNDIYQDQKNQEVYDSALSVKRPVAVGGIPEEIWQQTYVSCIMRNILFSDSLENNKPAMVQNTILSTKSAAKKIIELIVRMLPKGFLSGCSELHQGPDFIHNYLVDTLLKILKISELYDFAVKIIEPYISYNFNYHLLLVQLLIESNLNELRLVTELHKGLDYYSNLPIHFRGKNYIDFYLLRQSKLMTEKGNFDLALYLATKAIETNPTEFLNWTNLLETYITKKDVHNALLTLNSCPIYSLPVAKTVQRIREENSIHDFLSLKDYSFPEPSQEGFLEAVWAQANRSGPVYLKDKDTLLSEDFVSDLELKTVDPILLKLSGPKLKGTFKAAYNYLSSLAILVGWDKLLKVRADVFVMEGEYKTTHSPSESDILNSSQATLNGFKMPRSGLISHDSINNNQSFKDKNMALPVASVDNQNKERQVNLKSKRLCERWLDSLFFMLYDDLRVVSLWEVEARKTGNAISHSTIEWELIGITAFRAKHYDLALSALRTSLKAKFSIITAASLLQLFEEFYQDYHSFKRLNVNFEQNKYAKDLLFVGLNNILFPTKKEFVIDKYQVGNLPISQQLKLINEQSLEHTLYLDLILEVLIKMFSWNFRWYSDFSIDCLIFLKDILKYNEKDLVINKLRAAYETEGNAVRLFERYISWIEMFNDE